MVISCWTWANLGAVSIFTCEPQQLYAHTHLRGPECERNLFPLAAVLASWVKTQTAQIDNIRQDMLECESWLYGRGSSSFLGLERWPNSYTVAEKSLAEMSEGRQCTCFPSCWALERRQGRGGVHRMREERSRRGGVTRGRFTTLDEIFFRLLLKDGMASWKNY